MKNQHPSKQPVTEHMLISRDAFLHADRLSPIDEQRKSAALKTLQQEIAGKKFPPLRSKRQIWQNSLRYADRSMVLIHAFLCLFFLLALQWLGILHVGKWSALPPVVLLSALLGSSSILSLGRTCTSQLSELSESCFFNVKQLAAFDLARSGILSLTVLTLGILLICRHWPAGIFRTGLYVLVPFIFTQCGCLGILLTEKGRRNIWPCAAAGVFLPASCTVLASMPLFYTQAALLFWCMAFVSGTVLLGLEIRLLFTQINQGDILCTNWK